VTDHHWPRRAVDTASLQGLAHPLRVQLLEQLTHFGPATATQLAGRLGESSGATSYHLRQLARYGFVEEDPDRGSGRERWWRRVRGAISINTPKLNENEASREAAALVVNEFQRGRQARLEHWLRTFESWPRDWQDASTTGSIHLRLTVGELAALGDELEALFEEWLDRVRDREDPPGSRSVEVQLSIFPMADPADGRRPADAD
jgi:DNA-binding transcriptional ArsR family regulator